MVGRKLRLLHLEIRPVYVIDDGEHLITQSGESFTVASADVSSFSETFVAEFLALQEKFAADQIVSDEQTAHQMGGRAYDRGGAD